MFALVHRAADRARWELREWKRPSRRAFIHEELDAAILDGVCWSAGERVLDVGAARGEYVRELARRGVRVFGLDLSADLLRAAMGIGRPLVCADGGRLPIADGSIDAILCHKTMHLLPDPSALVAEFDRVLRPGGRIVFSGSSTRSPYALANALAIRLTRNGRWGYANRLSPRQWQRLFTNRGYRATAILPCNLIWPWVYRLCDRWIIPNEWMRRYNGWMRQVSGIPLRADRHVWLAQDCVVEMTKPGG